MKTYVCFVLVLLPTTLFAQGCITGKVSEKPSYVCVDGRSLSQTGGGLVWQAKRGCFMSRIPCCNYDATHYSYSANPGYVFSSYNRCRQGYPFHLGEMQTH